MRIGFVAGILFTLGLTAGAASAADQPLDPLADPFIGKFIYDGVPVEQTVFNEVRGGLFFHDAYPGFIPTNLNLFRLNRLEGLNLEVLFDEIDLYEGDSGFIDFLLSPRPNLGTTLSLGGRENMAHAALAWTLHLPDTPFFGEIQIGAGIHDGNLARRFGCRVQFYESASIGADLTDRLSAMLTYEHTSNANLCYPNAGLSNIGLRLGWKVD